MKRQNLIAKLNWRHVLMHSVAFWFFVHAFQTLSYLYDLRIVDIVRQTQGPFRWETVNDNNISTSDFSELIFWNSISGFVGLLVAFVISLSISIKRHWFWVNSLLAFLSVYLLRWFDLLGWTYLKPFFWYPGKKFNDSASEFIINGIFLLIIGFLIFFLKQPNRFIQRTGATTARVH